MPGDLPLVESPQRLNWRDRLSLSDTWARQVPLWEGFFVLAQLLGIVLTWVGDPEPTPHRITATVLLVALAAWWHGFGRRLVHREDPGRLPGTVYLLGVLVLFAPAAILVPDCSWALFGMSVQPFMVRRHREAILWVALLNVIPPLALLPRPDIAAADFWTQAAIAVATIGFAYLIGSGTERMASQSQERAELIEQLETSRAQFAELSRQAGVVAERQRLAAEIHDTLAQGFTSILTLVQAAGAELEGAPARAREHLELAARTARENLGEARALVGALTPAALDTGSLTDALRRQAGRLTEECGLRSEFTADGELGGLPTAIEVVLLRSAQEALANVRKHAGAGSVAVRLTGEPREVRLSVTDDGRGFDPAAPATGFGLRAMRSRVEQVGGRLRVDSAPGRTTVLVEVTR